MDANGAVQVPPELQAVWPQVEAYVNARIQQFAGAFARRVNLNVAPQQLDALVSETLSSLAQPGAIVSQANRQLRLVLRHDCQSTGCGEPTCIMCQYNTSRLCRRNLKAKYLIDDYLKAKCNASLRVEVVDENGRCVEEGLAAGLQLEVHVLNGEKYKEVCPENTLLSHAALKTCIISHHTKALLKRESSNIEELRVFLPLERGVAPLSDLAVTTSSEALLCGKAPTFRLLVWAVDAEGAPSPGVTYVVSENFVVATKRVKHAIKSDIPLVADHVSKLVHIGKATVDKLLDLRAAGKEENMEINVPDDLNRVEKVGQFRHLVQLTDINSDLKHKVRHLLKLSPEKWEEASQHALAAVVPDFRPRVWWCPSIRSGLLFSCKNGSVVFDNPAALIKMASKPGAEDTIVPIHQLDLVLFNALPKLKAQALTAWYAAGHPGWAVYWRDPAGGQQPASGMPGSLAPASVAPSDAAQAAARAAGAAHEAAEAAALHVANGGGHHGALNAMATQLHTNHNGAGPSTSGAHEAAAANRPGAAAQPTKSPFAATAFQMPISDAFPAAEAGGSSGAAGEPSFTAAGSQDMGLLPGSAPRQAYGSLEGLKTEDLPGLSVGLPSGALNERSVDWMAALQGASSGGLTGFLHPSMLASGAAAAAMAAAAVAAGGGAAAAAAQQQQPSAADGAANGITPGGSLSQAASMPQGMALDMLSAPSAVLHGDLGGSRQLSLKFSMSTGNSLDLGDLPPINVQNGGGV